jgi:5'(3')-deoxyribonucleotidase
MNTIKKYMIYLDMDGVISDLDTNVLKYCNGDKRILEDRNNLYKILPKYAKDEGFYQQNIMKNARELVLALNKHKNNKLIDIAILTSTGTFLHPTSIVANQKKRWLEKHFFSLSNVPFCATSSGKDKAMLAHPKAILIDDHENNVKYFREHGGLAFHYKDPDEYLGAIEFVEKQIYGEKNEPSN